MMERAGDALDFFGVVRLSSPAPAWLSDPELPGTLRLLTLLLSRMFWSHRSRWVSIRDFWWAMGRFNCFDGARQQRSPPVSIDSSVLESAFESAYCEVSLCFAVKVHEPPRGNERHGQSSMNAW